MERLPKFKPPHDYALIEGDVTDPETLNLVRDALAVYRGLFQGMVPVGTWLEARVETLVREWLPEWEVSHAQVVDLERQEIQSRSWDLVVHKPVPEELGLPPPAKPGRGWALVPRHLCCAVVDVKGRFDAGLRYAEASAFNVENTCDIPQLKLLGPGVLAAVLAITSAAEPQTLSRSCGPLGLETFVLARARDRQRPRVWELHRGEIMPPLIAFKGALQAAAARWNTT